MLAVGGAVTTQRVSDLALWHLTLRTAEELLSQLTIVVFLPTSPRFAVKQIP